MKNFIWIGTIVILLSIMACDSPKALEKAREKNPVVIKLDDGYSIVRLNYNGSKYTFLQYENYTTGGNYGVSISSLDYESSGLGSYKP